MRTPRGGGLFRGIAVYIEAMSAKPLRLFIAVELNPELRRALGQVQANLQRALPAGAVRWTRPDGIHLTLKFLGDTPEEQTPAIVAGMTAAAAGFDPCELQVAGFGAFPTPRQPRVLWVGLPDLPRPLAGVQRALELHLARLGYPRETRPFNPHLTLGRVNDRGDAAGRQALSAALGRVQVGELGRVAVEEIVLFQSELRPDGAVYTALARAPLAVGRARSETGPSG